MQLTLISRISPDKDFFIDIIRAVEGLNIDLTFVGDVEDEGIYEKLVKEVEKLGLSARISFTKESIPYEDLPSHLRSGYFINFSVGHFFGYSSIECIQNGFKTIFYNIDERYKVDRPCFSDSKTLKNLLISLNEDEIKKENKKLLSTFLLNESESEILLSMFI